ncbi:hypothetical protein EB796_017556 [Bugula neritina]|uniref:Uncharacterized protein n=1 Tax=Bugula neritina TaxID=10212 RepID=A0A7J7JEZ7_BUGNE|nr:hypothetical protein EB796_017556 [Bugula neritina]
MTAVDSNSEVQEQMEDEGEEVKMVPVFDIDGEMYQQYRKPSEEDWEMSLIWRRHTVSSKAKDWGSIKARQSRPIPVLYQRLRNFDSVPAFKQYKEDELKTVIDRVQRPTKSAVLKSSHKDGSPSICPNTQNNGNGHSYDQQQAVTQRLLRPTKSQAHRVQLTLKYHPKQINQSEATPSNEVCQEAENTTSHGEER